MRRDPWQALADPTRREIISLLREGPLTINEVVEHFDISRPAISKQVKILAECGLLNIVNEGRKRICTLNAEPLQEVADWLSYYEEFWLGKLDHLEKVLNKKSSKTN